MELPLLTGKTIVAVDAAESPGPCSFHFSDGSYVHVECDWRIVHDGQVALAAKDHRQLFGRQESVDATREATTLLAGKKVTRACLSQTGDLVVEFEGATRLETFTNSSGYESGSIRLADGRRYVVVGGGDVVEF
jgi:Family of unknown function (DUF6188)